MVNYLTFASRPPLHERQEVISNKTIVYSMLLSTFKDVVPLSKHDDGLIHLHQNCLLKWRGFELH